MPTLPDRRSARRSADLVPRAITPRLLEALADSRAVAVIGPRQAGKTTLVRDLIRTEYPAAYVTLDEAVTRNAARTDPTGVVEEMTGPTIIDEIQRAPDLLLSIKERLDRDDRPGQFLMVVHTDGWRGYNGLPEAGYTRKKTVLSDSGDPAHVSMPAVHRVASLLKRWLLGTHQGSVGAEQLDYYLDEFTFRFNRRTSRSRGLLFYRLLEQAVVTDHATYDLITRRTL